MNWTAFPFENLYYSIENGSIDLTIFKDLVEDLRNLNLNDKQKNTTSRSQLEKGEITLSNGDKYNVSQEFIIAAIKLSDELNVDELIVCELMMSDSIDSNSLQNLNQDDLSLINSGKTQYYIRRQYILQIVSYIVNCIDKDSVVFQDLIKSNILIKNILPAFQVIHNQLSDIKEHVNKAQILDNYNTLFQQNVKFKRDFLLKEYDSLSQILYGLVNNGLFNSKNQVNILVNHMSSLDSDDFFMVYYIPAVFHLFSKLNDIPDTDVTSMHSQFLNDLKDDAIYANPMKVSVIFIFLTFFISWCKEKPNERATNLDFKTAVDEPMTRAVELGAIEQLLVLAADTSIIEKDKSMDLFYDIRSLLERHIPRFIPKQLIDSSATYNNINTGNTISSNSMTINSRFTNINPHTNGMVVDPRINHEFQFQNIVLSDQAQAFYLSSFHIVIQQIIADCAFLLTKIKDAEEDSLLSGEDLDLDDISIKADLERFFLVVSYFYASRPELCSCFWEDKDSNAYGFIEWAAKCNDSLMRACFYLMISSLSCGKNNSSHVFHYFGESSIVSWTIISQCIGDYIVKIGDLNNSVHQRQQTQESSDVKINTVALELGLNEEAIIFLSSLLTLVGSVSHDVDTEVKDSLSTLFTDNLFEFAKLDTPLVGACLKTLGHLVPDSFKSKSKFWVSLDAMIFKGASLSNTNESYRNAFTSVLTNYTEVLGFLQLLERLFKSSSDNMDRNKIIFGTLEYPTKLGQGYRKIGIWPYIDYLLNDILSHSSQIDDKLSRFAVQLPTLRIIVNAIGSFDYDVILNSIPAGADLNKLVVCEDFFTYVQESSATAVFNYIFTESVYGSIFKIVSVGIDCLSIDLEGGKQQRELMNLAIEVIDKVLQHEETFIEELAPIIKKNQKDSYFLPKDFGLHGLRSFFDAIFFNLPVIAHLGLYVGLDDFSIAFNSLNILSKLSVKYSKKGGYSSMGNKFLTVLDSVDESARIKDSFITQIDSPIDSEDNLTLKLHIMDFINSNLSYSDKTVTESHLLLGFQVTNVLSSGPDLATFISSDVSLLNSLIQLAQAALSTVDPADISYTSMRLASMAFEIILKLCRNPLTSNLTFDYLSTHNFFEAIMELDPKANKFTLWNSKTFPNNSAADTMEFIQSESIGAFFCFLNYRNLLIQYLSLFIHRISFMATESQVLTHVNYLISSTLYSARIFSFLDTLNFGNILSEKDQTENLSIFSDLKLDLEKVIISSSCGDNIFDFSSVESLMKLYSRVKTPDSESVIVTQERKDKIKKYHDEAEKEIITTKKCITNYLCRNKTNELQLSILHSWVQLAQIIVTDGKLNSVSRSNFILEIYSAIVPKINDYVEYDVGYSEELVSLAVFLYDIYQKDRFSIDKHKTLDSRLYNLFKVCIHGITSPLSSVSLRSDFYTLANQYLVRILKDEAVAKEVVQNLRINSGKFVEVICNDAIYGEGTSKITGILLLDSLVQIANNNKENFILETLTKSAYLLLIIRSLKNADVLLHSSSDRISMEDLLYELTAFKATTFFLVHLAQTRVGAQSLIQNKLLQILSECTFLKVDPDLGLNVLLNNSAVSDSEAIALNITLDEPVSFGSEHSSLSLFELIIPVFQLMTAVLISVGRDNTQIIYQVKNLLIAFRKLLIGVFKRDALYQGRDVKSKYANAINLEQMVKLTVTLCTLTDYGAAEVKDM